MKVHHYKGYKWAGRFFRKNAQFFFISNFIPKNEFFGDFLENASEFLAEISYLDSSQHYLQLFYWSLGQEILSSPILTLLAMGGIWPALGNFAFVRKIRAGLRPAYYVTLNSILLGTF